MSKNNPTKLEKKPNTKSKLFSESLFIGLTAVGILFLVSLLTYSKTENPFSGGVLVEPVMNQAGVFGAYLSDILMSLLGYSSFWFAFIFLFVVCSLLYFSEKALRSPWGRMMRAIRDNEDAAKAMGKNVVKQHLFIFMLGSAIIGFAGAMLVTYDGLFTPSSYQPLRYTFLIWVMVLLGGTGNNYGAILGAFVVWFIWIQSAPFALYVINLFTSQLDESNAIKLHLVNSIPYFRYLMMGLGLLVVMRYKPKGLLPEKVMRN